MKFLHKTLIVMVLISCLLMPQLTINAASLPIKNAWIVNSTGNLFSLTANGDLYFGENIYSQNKELVLNNVNAFIETNGDAFVILNSGDIVRIPTDYRFDENNMENNLHYFKNVKARKLLEKRVRSGCFFINEDKELMLINQFDKIIKIYDNVKSVYAINSDEYFLLLNNNKLVLYEDGNIIPMLEDVANINYGIVTSIITNKNDLYYIDVSHNNYIPTRIATNVKSVLNANRRHSNALHVPYIDANDNLYFYNIESNITELVMEGAKDCFYLSPYYYIIGTDNNLYIDKTNTYSDKYNPTIVQRDIKELVYSIDRRYFFNSTNNELYEGYRPSGASPKLIFSPTGLNNIISVSGSAGHGIGYCDYVFVSNEGCVYGADYYGTKIKEPVHTIYCQKPLRLVFNGKDIALTLKVQNINNRTMYPFRECLENFGATVLWDSVSNSAIGKLNGRTVEFPIGKQEYYVDGVRYEMDTNTYVDSSLGRTYIPIRYAAEGLGFTVEWIEEKTENIISIHK